jgi:predicted nicotinamide N-methyase
MESVATFGEVPDLSDACLVDYLQMAPTADVLEILRDEDPERAFGAKAQAALLRCLRHPVAIAHPPGRPYRERLLKLAVIAAERDGLELDDGVAEAHAEALCEPRTGDQWCHKTFVLDVAPREETTERKQRPVRITVRTHPNLFEGGTGCHEWAAGFALAELVASHAERFANKRVVEIGPGVGVAAIALAKITRPRGASALTLLDRDNETLANLAANLELNGIPSRILKHDDDDDDDDEREAGDEDDPNDEDDFAIPKPRVSLSRLDWHDFDPARLASLRADVVVAADVLYDPSDVPALLDVAAALLGPREEAAARDEKKKKKTRAEKNEPLALFVSAVRQPATLALFEEVAAERGFDPVDVTEAFAATKKKGVGFRRLAKEQLAEVKVHALRPPKAPR